MNTELKFPGMFLFRYLKEFKDKISYRDDMGIAYAESEEQLYELIHNFHTETYVDIRNLMIQPVTTGFAMIDVRGDGMEEPYKRLSEPGGWFNPGWKLKRDGGVV